MSSVMRITTKKMLILYMNLACFPIMCQLSLLQTREVSMPSSMVWCLCAVYKLSNVVTLSIL